MWDRRQEGLAAAVTPDSTTVTDSVPADRVVPSPGVVRDAAGEKRNR